MKNNNLFLPFDVFERHKMVSSFIKNSEDRILDVGGGVEGLGRFIENKVTVTNLNAGDVIADGRNLPFTNSQFDIVTNIDVLEHIPKKDRQKFVNELLRVARKKVIVSTPLGSDVHSKAEKKLLAYLENRGSNSDYLREHIKNGLPTKEELKGYFSDEAFFLFSGDFRLNNFLFRAQIKQFENSLINKAFFYLQKLVSFLLNVFYFPFIKSEKPKRWTNRVFVIYEKGSYL